MLCPDEFFLEVVEVIVIEVKLPFERPIGYALSGLEQLNDLVNNLIEFHTPSDSVSSRAFASFKSAVSKPSVNQL